MQDIKHQMQAMIVSLEEKAKKANEANFEVVQLAWDLGDTLISVKEKTPEMYDTLLSSLNVKPEIENAWLRVRKSAETKDDLLAQNSMRQAMLAICVPHKETGEERVELSPPETFYNWVNKSNSWLKKVEYGLVKCDRGQLKTATQGLYGFLKSIHEA